jgi:hypothetical protein
MSTEGARVGRLLGRLSNQYIVAAQCEGMPQDLMQSMTPNTGDAVMSNDDSTNTTEEDENASIATGNINYCLQDNRNRQDK